MERYSGTNCLFPGPETWFFLKRVNRLGAELGLVNNPIFVKSEFIVVNDTAGTYNGLYLAFGYRIKNF